MIKIAKFGEENCDKLREHVRNHINMVLKDEDCYVFGTSSYIQKIIKEQFPEAQLEIVPSDEKLYQESYKVQSSMKLRSFKRVNGSLKDDDTILVIIKSHPREANEEKAEEFAQYVAKNCYEQGEKGRLVFIIRGWLRKQFMDIKTNKKLQDKNGKELEGNNVWIGRSNYPIQKPMDKAIKVKLYVKLGDVQAIIDAMNKRELTSTIDFINTQVRKQKREENKEKKNKSRFQKRQNAANKDKASEEKTENTNEEKKEKKDKRFKNRKSAPADKQEKKEPKGSRSQSKTTRKEEPVEEINIEIEDKKTQRPARIIIDLQEKPKDTPDKLIKALKDKLDFAQYKTLSRGDL